MWLSAFKWYKTLHVSVSLDFALAENRTPELCNETFWKLQI